MKKRLKILVIAKLKPSQIEYKLHPLINSEYVDKVYALRKFIGPKLPKLHYIVLPEIFRYKFLYILLTPFWGLYYVNKIKPNLILSYHFIPHGFNAAVISFLSGIPFIYSQIDMDIEKICENKFSKFIVYQMLRRAKYIFTPGTRASKFWKELGIPDSQVKVVHSSIDTDSKFTGGNYLKLYDILYLGTFDNNKRTMFLMEVFREVVQKEPTVKIAIAGFGELEPNILAFINDNKLAQNVLFLGKVNEPSEVMKQSKLFIMASIDEGLPCALMEAMALELIVLTTPAGDIPDIVMHNKTGIIITKIDIHEVMNTVLYTLNNYSNYTSIRHEARKIIINHRSYSSTTNIWDQLLEGIMHENPH